jgi:hypothetical protein
MDAVEDSMNTLNAKYGPLWDVYQDVDSKIAQQRAHLKEYVDDMMKRQSDKIARLEAELEAKR